MTMEYVCASGNCDIVNELIASLETTQISIPDLEISLQGLVQQLNDYIEERNDIVCRLNELSLKYAEIQIQNKNMKCKLDHNEQQLTELKNYNVELDKIIQQKNQELLLCQRQVKINPKDTEKLKKQKQLYDFAKKITGVKFTVDNEHCVEGFVFNEHTGYLKHFHYDNWRDDIANNLWQLIGKGCTKN